MYHLKRIQISKSIFTILQKVLNCWIRILFIPNNFLSNRRSSKKILFASKEKMARKYLNHIIYLSEHSINEKENWFL